MAQENYFYSKFKDRNNEDLKYIVEHPTLHDNRAVEAAHSLLSERGLETPKITVKKEALQQRNQLSQESIKHRIGIPITTQSWTNRLLHAIIDGFLLYLLGIGIAIIPAFNMNTLASIILFPIYYIFFESQYGQTPGKMVTDSVVCDAQGNRPTMKQIILRTAARYIPFEGLTCWSNPSWGLHDRWTKTYVMRKKDVEKLVTLSNVK